MEPSKMGLEEARQLLGNCILFRGLKADERDAILGRVRTRVFKAGDTVFAIGSPGDNMMAVLSGTIRISVPAPDGKELLLAILQPGEVFGELAVLDGKERSADAVANSPCTLAILDRRDMLSFLEQHPAVWLKLITVLCERLRHTDQQLAEVALLQLPARLAKTMLRISNDESRSTASPGQPTIQLSQQELANMVGGTRERVNKCLAAWRREGLVKMSGGTITISNMPALQLISEQG
jgi:CRP/FNR family transcriptional regulator, cyclic AMP receptor protein